MGLFASWIFSLIGERGHPFPNGAAIESGCRPSHKERHQRRFEIPLSINDQVVLGFPDIFDEIRNRFYRGDQPFPPSAVGRREDPVHCAVPFSDLGKTLIDHPIEFQLRIGAGRIGQRRQSMDEIAKRGEFNKEDAFHFFQIVVLEPVLKPGVRRISG